MTRQIRSAGGPVLAAAILVLFLLSLKAVGLLDATRIGRGLDNLATFARDLVPPDRSVLSDVVPALLETIQMAFAGTGLGFLVALPLSLLAARQVAPPGLRDAIKLVLSLVRTIPAILWAIIFVVALGLGPAAGTMGVALYTTGFLGKVFYEAFEGVDQEVVEAVKSVGAGRAELARHALIPEASNAIASQLLFMFEYNVRSSSIMGFVGAGGIGFYLLGYVQSLEYRSLTTAILVTLVVVVLIDYGSSRLRALLR